METFIPTLQRIQPQFTEHDYSCDQASRVIVHIDMDCFFAAVAVVGNPAWKDKPIAISHSTSTKSESKAAVSSCNYQARRSGIHAEMRIGVAREKCPDLIVLPYEFKKYQKISEQMYEIFYSLTHRVRAHSVDEAFLELPMSQAHNATQLAQSLRQAIFDRTGCVASAGIGPNVLMAKMATNLAKPDGCVCFSSRSDPTFLSHLASLPVKKLPGVGRNLSRVLQEEHQITTVGQLRTVEKRTFASWFAEKTALLLYNLSRGIDKDEHLGNPPRALFFCFLFL